MNNSKPDQKLKNKYLQLLKDPNFFNIHLEDLKKMIEERTDKVKVLNEILTLSENIYESYLKASSTQKKKYLRMFFEGIHVDDRKIVRVEYNPVIADLTKIREVRLSDNWRRE